MPVSRKTRTRRNSRLFRSFFPTRRCIDRQVQTVHKPTAGFESQCREKSLQWWANTWICEGRQEKNHSVGELARGGRTRTLRACLAESSGRARRPNGFVHSLSVGTPTRRIHAKTDSVFSKSEASQLWDFAFRPHNKNLSHRKTDFNRIPRRILHYDY